MMSKREPLENATKAAYLAKSWRTVNVDIGAEAHRGPEHQNRVFALAGLK